MRPGFRIALGAFAALALSLALASPAGASFRTGIAGAEYQSADPSVRGRWLEAAEGSGASLVRLFVSWRDVASARPSNAANPADPAYHFGSLDAAVADAVAHGIEPVLTIGGTPDFAEGAGRPPSAPPGSWMPDPQAYGEFAQALAARYSGSFAGLPRVRYFQAWNEPNLGVYLSPQYRGKRLAAPAIYRALLNAFYAGVKSVAADNVVITGGTAPYGDPPGHDRTRPLTFLRKLLCLRGHGHLERTKCPVKAKFDVLAHNAITTAGPPTRSAVSRDDAATPDFKNVARVLRAAERHHTTGTPGHHQLWATEIWWSSDPPDRRHGVSLAKQARYIEQALYILWKQGAKAVINLQIRDPDQFDVAAGLFFAAGSAKPSFEAFRFPLVAERTGRRAVRIWGKAPSAGAVEVQRKGHGWTTVKSLTVGLGQVFTARLRLKGPQRLRAVLNGEQSLVWTQR
jgi:hypothetical protein